MIEVIRSYSMCMHGASGFPGWVTKAICCWVFGVELTAPGVCRAENQASLGPAIPPVTNVIQLSRLGSQNPTVSYYIRLEGDILWVDPAQGEFVLQDASGTEGLEMDLQGRSLEP